MVLGSAQFTGGVMPFFYFAPVIRTSMVKLRCPACGKAQVRERKAEGASYRCKHCGKNFVGKRVVPYPSDGEDARD
jgi:ribosomal protein L37AE/L43A